MRARVLLMDHEMWTPLHAIIALSSLLLETELTPEQRLMVETVLKSSNLLATLINDVLDLSKLEDGSLELESAAFNLRSVFREAINLIKPIAAVKQILVLVTLAPDLPLCAIGDEKRLLQTILNICWFINLMAGPIWVESDGAGKGCTATFIVKLGICENSSGRLQQIMPVSRSNNGDAGISSTRAFFKDENGLVPSTLRYQRSV